MSDKSKSSEPTIIPPEVMKKITAAMRVELARNWKSDDDLIESYSRIAALAFLEGAALMLPESADAEDARRWREHRNVVAEASKPDALLIRLTMNEGGKVWSSQYVLDTAKFGRDTVLGIEAVGLSAQAQATKLFEAMKGSG